MIDTSIIKTDFFNDINSLKIETIFIKVNQYLFADISGK